MNERENFMRNASMQGHEWIPASVCFSGATWYQEREAIEEVCLRHPVLFPGFEKGKTDFDAYKTPPRYTDPWGCRWEGEIGGLMGLVAESPLADWESFEAYRPPAPVLPDEKAIQALRDARRAGKIASGDLEHGFFFMRLFYLRGFDNFMMDVAGDEPRLQKLIEVVASHHEQIIRAYLSAGIDVLGAGDDLGTQTASMIGRRHFRRWIFPTYRRLFQPARRAGAHVLLHSDGYMLDLVDDIIESGVSIVNPQDLVNGVDAIARCVKGRACIRCDIDRQTVLPFGSPGDVRELVREEVVKLGAPAGGLEFIAGIYPPTPPRNVEALCSALEEFRTYWVGR